MSNYIHTQNPSRENRLGYDLMSNDVWTFMTAIIPFMGVLGADGSKSEDVWWEERALETIWLSSCLILSAGSTNLSEVREIEDPESSECM